MIDQDDQRAFVMPTGVITSSAWDDPSSFSSSSRASSLSSSSSSSSSSSYPDSSWSFSSTASSSWGAPHHALPTSKTRPPILVDVNINSLLGNNTNSTTDLEPIDPSLVKYRRYSDRVMVYSWLWIGGITLFLVFLHSYRSFKHSRRRKRGIRRIDNAAFYKAVPNPSAGTHADDSANQHDEDEQDALVSFSDHETKRPIWIRRVITGVGANYRNTMYLRRFPWWLYGPETFMDAAFTIVYSVVYGYFCLSRTDSWLPLTHRNVANRMGIMSFSQLPIILLLVSKNNPISSLTGITYQKLNYLHRASSRVCLLTSWLHALLWTPRVWEAGDTRPYLLCGIAALTGFTMLWLTSFRIVRRVAYEFFLVSHILFSLLYLIGAIFHWYRLWYWVAPALAIWAFDRGLRFLKVMYQNDFFSRKRWSNHGDSKIELLDHDVMRITIRRNNFHWAAGQHGFISAPSVSLSPHETHPFSIANVPTDSSNDAVFLVRVHSGFTKRLRTALTSDLTTTIPLYLEGPYGFAHSLNSFSSVMLVAGGTGVTFVLGHWLQILGNARKGLSAVRQVRLVWHIRHAEDIEWIAPLLNEGCADIPDSVNVVIDVFVTKTHASDEPWPDAPEIDLHETIHDVPRRILQLQHLESARGNANGNSYGHGNGHENGNDHGNGIYNRGWDEGCRTCAPGTPITESRDETLLLPKRATMLGRYGLTSETAEKVRWKRGRANLGKVVLEEASGCKGAMNVSVCGPVQLLHATKQAVAEVSNMSSSLEGLTSIDFFEETLGA